MIDLFLGLVGEFVGVQRGLGIADRLINGNNFERALSKLEGNIHIEAAKLAYESSKIMKNKTQKLYGVITHLETAHLYCRNGYFGAEEHHKKFDTQELINFASQDLYICNLLVVCYLALEEDKAVEKYISECEQILDHRDRILEKGEQAKNGHILNQAFYYLNSRNDQGDIKDYLTRNDFEKIKKEALKRIQLFKLPFSNKKTEIPQKETSHNFFSVPNQEQSSNTDTINNQKQINVNKNIVFSELADKRFLLKNIPIHELERYVQPLYKYSLINFICLLKQGDNHYYDVYIEYNNLQVRPFNPHQILQGIETIDTTRIDDKILSFFREYKNVDDQKEVSAAIYFLKLDNNDLFKKLKHNYPYIT